MLHITRYGRILQMMITVVGSLLIVVALLLLFESGAMAIDAPPDTAAPPVTQDGLRSGNRYPRTRMSGPHQSLLKHQWRELV